MHKKKAGKLQTGITFPKQYWLAVNDKPKTVCTRTQKAARIKIALTVGLYLTQCKAKNTTYQYPYLIKLGIQIPAIVFTEKP